LFRVLAGRLPFLGTSMQEKYVSATTGARPSLRKFRPDLPPAADDWVALALALDREQRFANVSALWSAFESAFRTEQRRSGLRPSFWAAAKGAVQKLVGGSQPAPVARAFGANEPSFTRDALARSAYRISAVPEATIELSVSDLQQSGPPPLKRGPLRRGSLPEEQTININDADLLPEQPKDD